MHVSDGSLVLEQLGCVCLPGFSSPGRKIRPILDNCAVVEAVLEKQDSQFAGFTVWGDQEVLHLELMWFMGCTSGLLLCCENENCWVIFALEACLSQKPLSCSCCCSAL